MAEFVPGRGRDRQAEYHDTGGLVNCSHLVPAGGAPRRCRPHHPHLPVQAKLLYRSTTTLQKCSSTTTLQKCAVVLRQAQLLYRNVQWFRGGLVLKAHTRVYHSTLGRGIKKKKKHTGPPALRVGSNRLFQVLDFSWHSPKSGDLWYKSKRLN